MKAIREYFDTATTAVSLIKVWQDLFSKTSIECTNRTLEEFISVSKAYVTLIGNCSRGTRFPYLGDNSRYTVVIHGEYGYVVIWVSIDQSQLRLGIYKSEHYSFNHIPETVQDNMDTLLAQSIAAGFEVPALLQWYDSTYRKVTGRRISPHFDEVSHVDKLIQSVLPGLLVLHNKE